MNVPDKSLFFLLLFFFFEGMNHFHIETVILWFYTAWAGNSENDQHKKTNKQTKMV